jgi:hypothetical protein
MAEPQWLDSSLGRIRHKSQQFSERASEVSKIIEHVDAHLRDMPGKTSVEVAEDGITLGVGRAFNWGIWITDDESKGDFESDPEELITVSVKRKIRAFPLLIKLLDEIEAEQDRQLKAIDSAGALLLERLQEGK